MIRSEKIEYLVNAIWEIEGATVGAAYFEDYADEQLDKEVLWYDYLLDK